MPSVYVAVSVIKAWIQRIASGTQTSNCHVQKMNQKQRKEVKGKQRSGKRMKRSIAGSLPKKTKKSKKKYLIDSKSKKTYLIETNGINVTATTTTTTKTAKSIIITTTSKNMKKLRKNPFCFYSYL